MRARIDVPPSYLPRCINHSYSVNILLSAESGKDAAICCTHPSANLRLILQLPFSVLLSCWSEQSSCQPQRRAGLLQTIEQISFHKYPREFQAAHTQETQRLLYRNVALCYSTRQKNGDVLVLFRSVWSVSVHHIMLTETVWMWSCYYGLGLG